LFQYSLLFRSKEHKSTVIMRGESIS